MDEVVFWVFVGAMVLDGVLLVCFVPGYYRSGVVVLRSTVPCHAAMVREVGQGLLNELGDSGGSTAPLVSRSLGSHCFGFRENLFSGRFLMYTPIMHGLVEVDVPANAIHVSGRLNFFPVVFTVVLLHNVVPAFGPAVFLVLGLIFGISYFLQARRFTAFGRRIAAAVQEGTAEE